MDAFDVTLRKGSSFPSCLFWVPGQVHNGQLSGQTSKNLEALAACQDTRSAKSQSRF